MNENTIKVAEATVSCECSEVLGEACDWIGPADETVIIESMPGDLRGSRTAGDLGSYPKNGARRLRVSVDCARNLIEADNGWTIAVAEPFGFVVYQVNGPIYGVGDDREEALSDASQWVEEFKRDEVEEYRAPVKGRGGNSPHALVIAPASAALVSRVRHHGGDLVYDMHEGIAVTREEFELLDS